MTGHCSICREDVTGLREHVRLMHPDGLTLVDEALEKVDAVLEAGVLASCSNLWCTNRTFAWLGVCGSCRMAPRWPHGKPEDRQVGPVVPVSGVGPKLRPFLLPAIEAHRDAVVSAYETHLRAAAPTSPLIAAVERNASVEVETEVQSGWLWRALQWLGLVEQ